MPLIVRVGYQWLCGPVSLERYLGNVPSGLRMRRHSGERTAVGRYREGHGKAAARQTLGGPGAVRRFPLRGSEGSIARVTAFLGEYRLDCSPGECHADIRTRVNLQYHRIVLDFDDGTDDASDGLD